MTDRAEARRSPATSRWLWGVSCLLLVGAALGLTIGMQTSDVGPASAPAVGRTSLPRSSPAVPALARSTPVHLSIPSLGISVRLSALGLNPDGTVEVPTDIYEAGWYRYGSTPGQLGSAVILGHVDSYRGPAAFFTLRDAAVGSAVDVTLANGTIARFVVIGKAMYLKTRFPSHLVYGHRDYSALQLVTCGGTFDHARGSYLSNVVVYTALAPHHGGTSSVASRRAA